MSLYPLHKSTKPKRMKPPQHSLLNLHSQTSTKLYLKYKLSHLHYGSTVINNIIYNEKSHIVALFKDFLILDDTSEFLKRYYTQSESAIRLPRFYEYYETYSKIYPNYTSLLEGKFIYRNIQRKQRMIDLQEQMEMNVNQRQRNNNHCDISGEVFSTDVYDSIINDRNNEDIEMLFNINIEKNSEEEEVFVKCMEKIVSDIERNDTVVVSNDCKGGNNKGERSLIEKIERNLLRAKSKTNNNSINSSNKSISAYSYHYESNIKAKINDLKLLYQKNIRNSYISFNENNIANAQMSYRGNNSLISNENVPLPKSPLTERIMNNNNNNQTENKSMHKKTHSNSIVVNNTHSNNKADNNTNSNNKHSPTPSNVIYIINQNPKFTTHVNVYNSGNGNSNMKHHAQSISSSSSMKRIINSAKPHLNSNTNNTKPSSSSMKSTSTIIQPYQHRSTCKPNSALGNNKQNRSSSKSKHSTINSSSNIKKRNISNTNSHFISGSGNINYLNMLKTAREIGYKDLNMLKSTSKNKKRSCNNNNNNSNSNNSSIKYRNLSSKRVNDKNKQTLTSRNVSNRTKQSDGVCNEQNVNDIISRNKRNVSNCNSSVKNNVMSKNDSLTKFGFADAMKVKKKIVKGIHIKNFSKIFNVNVSQLQGKSNRLPK